MLPKIFSFLFVVLIVHYASSKSVPVGSLTESHGQEIIEIKNPLKDLPDLEEEPSGENFETFKIPTTTQAPSNKKEGRRLGATLKDAPKLTPSEDDKRIEKELADLYRDNVDYKSDSAENAAEHLQKLDAKTTVKPTIVTSKETTTFPDKPIARANDFKFQPNINNKAEVERFRTSVDDITCDKKYTTVKLRHEKTSAPTTNAASINAASIVGLFCTILLNVSSKL